jgi:hypothetical protein
MSDPRIKGQEVELIFVENNQPRPTMVDVKSFEMSAQLEILKEGYLGETTDRRDSVYRGYSGKVEIHFENRQILDFTRRLVDKARRRTAGTQINCKATLNFPGGDRVRIVLKDLSFGEVPLAFGGRADFGTISLDFEGEDYQIV